MKVSRYLSKMVNWVAFKGDLKPTNDISDARWRAMYRHIMREYLA